MNLRLALSAITVLAVAGCATEQPIQMASAGCKIMPATTDSATGNAPRHVSELQQKFAQADLESSRYRMRNLQVNPANNNIEDAIRACDQQ
ncbi:MAG TPA: hypothetical protein VGI57_11740 [Usitatibacter sp.]